MLSSQAEQPHQPEDPASCAAPAAPACCTPPAAQRQPGRGPPPRLNTSQQSPHGPRPARAARSACIDRSVGRSHCPMRRSCEGAARPATPGAAALASTAPLRARAWRGSACGGRPGPQLPAAGACRPWLPSSSTAPLAASPLPLAAAAPPLESARASTAPATRREPASPMPQRIAATAASGLYLSSACSSQHASVIAVVLHGVIPAALLCAAAAEDDDTDAAVIALRAACSCSTGCSQASCKRA